MENKIVVKQSLITKYLNEIWKRDFTNSDLQDLHDNGNFIENNWFEFTVEFKYDRETIHSTDIVDDIDECIEVLNTFIKCDYENL